MSERIIETPVIGEVEQSFLDYSLSVITDRAIKFCIFFVIGFSTFVTFPSII